MPRPTGTQTRTFVYDGRLLVSATHPESGTSVYTYDANQRLTRVVKNNGARIDYEYDPAGRRTSMKFYGSPGASEPYETTSYYWDENPFDAGFSQYAYGRLAAVQYGTRSPVQELYSYNAAGRVSGQRLVVSGAGTDLLATYDSSDLGE